MDFRFTIRGEVLYAICMDWPLDGTFITVESLSTEQKTGDISDINLLGYKDSVKWERKSSCRRRSHALTPLCSRSSLIKAFGSGKVCAIVFELIIICGHYNVICFIIDDLRGGFQHTF